MAISLAAGTARSAYNIYEWQKLGFSPGLWYAQLGWRVAYLVLIIVVLIQLPKRSQFARWCGALMILTLLTSPIWMATGPKLQDFREISHVVGWSLVFGTLSYLLYAFAFSRKARVYFRSPARN